MVRNQTITSSVSASVSAELTESFQQTLSAPRWRTLDDLLGLPATLRGFLLLLLAATLVGAGMALLVMISVQIFQTRLQINNLQRQYRTLEQQNAELVWAIAEHTALPAVHQRATQLGYEAPSVRHFVVPLAPAISPATVPGELSLTNGRPAPTTDFWVWAQQQFQTIQHWWQR
jgi:hypothetical protein